MAAVAWQETCAIAQASYRLMAQALITNMIAAGFVQTGDTGQINPATIVIGTANGIGGTISEEYGYVMFRMNDSLAASYPLYIKIIFGAYFVTNNSTRRCNCRIIFGLATDGAGNLTGPTKEINSLGGAGTFTNTQLSGPHSSWCHHKEGLGALLAYRASWQTANGTSSTAQLPFCFFVVERTRDASGNLTGDGFYILSRGCVTEGSGMGYWSLANINYGSPYQPFLETTYLSPSLTNTTKFGGLWMGGEFSNSKSGAAQLQDIWAPHNGMQPFKSVKLYKTSLASPGDTTTLTQDGVAKPFLFAGSWGFGSDMFMADSTDSQFYTARVGLALEWA